MRRKQNQAEKRGCESPYIPPKTLAHAMSLARCAAILECGMHHIGLQSELVGHALCEASVAATEDGDGKDATLELAIVAPAQQGQKCESPPVDPISATTRHWNDAHSNKRSVRSGRGLEPRRNRSLNAFWSHTLASFSRMSTHSCSRLLEVCEYQ